MYEELIEELEEQGKNIQELQTHLGFFREITHHKELHESGLMSSTSLKKTDSEQSIKSEHSVVLSGVLLSGHYNLKKHILEQDKTMWEIKMQVEFLREITQNKDQEDESPSSPESLKKGSSELSIKKEGSSRDVRINTFGGAADGRKNAWGRGAHPRIRKPTRLSRKLAQIAFMRKWSIGIKISLAYKTHLRDRIQKWKILGRGDKKALGLL